MGKRKAKNKKKQAIGAQKKPRLNGKRRNVAVDPIRNDTQLYMQARQNWVLDGKKGYKPAARIENVNGKMERGLPPISIQHQREQALLRLENAILKHSELVYYNARGGDFVSKLGDDEKSDSGQDIDGEDDNKAKPSRIRPTRMSKKKSDGFLITNELYERLNAARDMTPLNEKSRHSLPKLPGAPSTLFDWQDQRLGQTFQRKRSYNPDTVSSSSSTSSSSLTPSESAMMKSMKYLSSGNSLLSKTGKYYSPLIFQRQQLQIERGNLPILEQGYFQNESVVGNEWLIDNLCYEAMAIARGGLNVFEGAQFWDSFERKNANEVTSIISIEDGSIFGVKAGQQNRYIVERYVVAPTPQPSPAAPPGTPVSPSNNIVGNVNSNNSSQSPSMMITTTTTAATTTTSTESHPEEYNSPRLVVGYDGEWISIPPHIAGEWEFAHLEPLSRFVSLCDYCIINVSNEKDSMPIKADYFVKELSALYDICNFGQLVGIEQKQQTPTSQQPQQSPPPSSSGGGSGPGNGSGTNVTSTAESGDNTHVRKDGRPVLGLDSLLERDASSLVQVVKDCLKKSERNHLVVFLVMPPGSEAYSLLAFDTMARASEVLNRSLSRGNDDEDDEGDDDENDEDDINAGGESNEPNNIESSNHKNNNNNKNTASSSGSSRISSGQNLGTENRNEISDDELMMKTGGGGSVNHATPKIGSDGSMKLESINNNGELRGGAGTNRKRNMKQKVLFQLLPGRIPMQVFRRTAMQKLSFGLFTKTAALMENDSTIAIGENYHPRVPTCIHLCYILPSKDSVWLVACWTDGQGQTLDILAQRACEKPVSMMIESILWNRTMQIMTSVRGGVVGQRLCISMVRKPSANELDCWTTLLTGRNLGAWFITRLQAGFVEVGAEVMDGEKSCDIRAENGKSKLLVGYSPLRDGLNCLPVLEVEELGKDRMELTTILHDFSVLSILKVVDVQSSVIPIHVHTAARLSFWLGDIS